MTWQSPNQLWSWLIFSYSLNIMWLTVSISFCTSCLIKISSWIDIETWGCWLNLWFIYWQKIWVSDQSSFPCCINIQLIKEISSKYFSIHRFKRVSSEFTKAILARVPFIAEVVPTISSPHTYTLSIAPKICHPSLNYLFVICATLTTIQNVNNNHSGIVFNTL